MIENIEGEPQIGKPVNLNEMAEFVWVMVGKPDSSSTIAANEETTDTKAKEPIALFDCE